MELPDLFKEALFPTFTVLDVKWVYADPETAFLCEEIFGVGRREPRRQWAPVSLPEDSDIDRARRDFGGVCICRVGIPPAE